MKTQYTISLAFVIETDTDSLGTLESDPLHKSILDHVSTLAELLRAQNADRDFRVMLQEMIIGSGEVELAPKRIV